MMATCLLLAFLSRPALSEQFEKEQCVDALNTEWNAAEKYFWRSLCSTNHINFVKRTLLSAYNYIEPDSDAWPRSRRISGSFIEEILTLSKYRPYVDNRTLTVTNVWLRGPTELHKVDVSTSLVFEWSKIENGFILDRSHFGRLVFKNSLISFWLSVFDSTLDEGLYIEGSNLKTGVLVQDSTLDDFHISDSKVFNRPPGVVRRRDIEGRIVREEYGESSAIRVDGANIGAINIVGTSAGNIYLEDLNAKELRLRHLSTLEDGEDEKDDQSLFITSIAVSGKFSAVNVDAFKRLFAINIEIDDDLFMHGNGFTTVDFTRLQAATMWVLASHAEEFTIRSAKIRNELAFSTGLGDVAEEGSWLGELFRDIEQSEPESIEDKEHELDINLSEVGSIRLYDENLDELTLVDVRISGQASFYLGQPPYNRVNLTEVKFGSLSGRESSTLKSDLEFLDRTKFAMENYLQFSESYREEGLVSEANELMISAYDRQYENVGMIKKVLYLLWRYLTGYGYKLEYTLGWCVFFVFLGSVIARLYSRKERKDDSVGFWYSFDLFFPFIRLKDEHRSVQFENTLLNYYFLFHQVVGFIVLSSFLAGLIDIMVD